MSASRTHYLNVDFDLSLRARFRCRASFLRQCDELSVQGLLGAGEEDAAIVRVPVSGEFTAYLRKHGIPVPRILDHPDTDPRTTLQPFGWSAEAMTVNRRHLRPVPHPPLEVIERVNARSYGLKLEVALDSGGPTGRQIEREADLDRFLARADPDQEWVLKAEHGNAGLGNRHLRGSVLSPEDRRFVVAILSEDDRFLIEPWLPRVRDWSYVFRVPFTLDTFRHHEVVNTQDGALIGSLFEPQPPGPAAGVDPMIRTAERVASMLQGDGYIGPVCADALEWRDGDRIRLRPLVDLNCRQSMSAGAHRLWQRMGPDRTLYYRFFSRRKLSLPDGLEAAVSALGDHAYSRSGNRGVLFASPLPPAGQDVRVPIKVATLFIGEDRSAALDLEHEFRARFEA